MRLLLAAVCAAACALTVGCGDETIVVHTGQETREDDEYLYGFDPERSAEEETGMEDGGFDADFDSVVSLTFMALITTLAAVHIRFRRRQVHAPASS